MTITLPLAAHVRRGWLQVPFPHPAYLTLAGAGDMRTDAVARRELRHSIGIGGAEVWYVTQVHSRRVLRTEESEVRSRADGEVLLGEADGLVCGPGGPYLAVGVADCMPVYLCDPASGAYGILHSGWRGTGILETAVRMMSDTYGTDPGRLVVTLGPCISSNAYRVDRERAEAFSVWGPGAVIAREDGAYLDLRAANLGIARRLGVTHVAVVDHCTVQSGELGSFRREGADYTGMLAIIGPRRGAAGPPDDRTAAGEERT